MNTFFSPSPDSAQAAAAAAQSAMLEGAPAVVEGWQSIDSSSSTGFSASAFVALETGGATGLRH